MGFKRVDRNQVEIVKAFRQAGCSVLVMSSLGKGAPDIAVGRFGKTFFFEIKDGSKPPSSRKLTPSEVKFKDEWRGHYGIINSLDDVTKFVHTSEI